MNIDHRIIYLSRKQMKKQDKKDERIHTPEWIFRIMNYIFGDGRYKK